MTTLLIARHGNTFEDGEQPRRVGARTDLPLTEKGREQGQALGLYLKENNLMPDVTYTSEMKRTIETAKEALIAADHPKRSLTALPIFNEIDYGPDENKTEEEMIARIGEQAIKDWDERNIVPEGWKADPRKIVQNWQDFAQAILENHKDQVVLVVTSNGIARFAPYLTGRVTEFRQDNDLKIKTGALCILKEEELGLWRIEGWNIKP